MCQSFCLCSVVGRVGVYWTAYLVGRLERPGVDPNPREEFFSVNGPTGKVFVDKFNAVRTPFGGEVPRTLHKLSVSKHFAEECQSLQRERERKKGRKKGRKVRDMRGKEQEEA